MRRMLCAWLPGWPTLLAARRSGAAPDRPLATVTAIRGQRRLAAICPRAEAAGLAPDMPLAQARAICPALQAVPADAEGDRAALMRLAAWGTRYTPLAAADPPDAIVLDITGCAHLWDGGEAALAADLAARLAAAGGVARIAVTGSAAAAWALARAAPCVLPPGQEAAALGPLPVEMLRLEGRVMAGLRRLGVRRVADLARLPRAEVAARFGAAPVARLDQAMGTAAEPIAWPHPPAPWAEERRFAEPLATAGSLAAALALLAGPLCARLAAARLGGQRFVARFARVDASVAAIAVATALPVNDAAYLARLLGAQLETVDPGFGIEAVTLAAETTGSRAPAQTRLGDLACSPGEALARTLDTLTGRPGVAAVWRPAPGGSHVPERSLCRAAPLAPPPGWMAGPPRPVRLLRRPEPVTVLAPVPDDPPLLFRWRGVPHQVRAASGPERIAAEWWRRAGMPEGREEADLVREYYRVEDRAGGRFWLFRTGRNAGAPGTRWFLHGLFG
ncbi:MAG TPA: DNA polymerase Y family protein [Acetobacteraceae bacterium]|nr:DNA polymerase Y family protein [Acetobacteraceae bacterium]